MEYYIWLQQILRQGSNAVLPIINRFGTPEKVFCADCNDLRLSGLFTSAQLSKIAKHDLTFARKALNDCKAQNIIPVAIGTDAYPELLQHIQNPPLVIYCKGDISLLNGEPCICVIGTRDVTDYGKKSAFSLSARLAAGGFTIVSGGAMGTDTAAHLGAISVEGKTICVYPAGICSSYLITNKPLRDEIAKKGLLLSEFPPMSELLKGTIPLRNRILSGLSLGIAVVEAPRKSGAVITAEMAGEQGRDVFAVPGGLNSPEYEGCNRLLADGAKLLTDARTVFAEYENIYPHKIDAEKAYKTSIKYRAAQAPEGCEKTQEKQKEQATQNLTSENGENFKKIINSNLSKTAQMLYNRLNKQIFSADEIRFGEISSAELLAAITELEIFGYIKALPGGRYKIL